MERERLLAKLHGKATVKKIGQTIPGGTSAPGLGALTTLVTPSYLHGLWRAFDVWGARQHDVAVKTFRDLRRTLQNSDDPLFRLLRQQGKDKPQLQRHRAK